MTSTSNGNGLRTSLSEKTYVQLGLVFAMLVGVAAIAADRATTSHRLDLLEQSISEAKESRKILNDISVRLASVELLLSSASNDRWRGTDMVRWAARLKDRNADKIDVPEPVINQQ